MVGTPGEEGWVACTAAVARPPGAPLHLHPRKAPTTSGSLASGGRGRHSPGCTGGVARDRASAQWDEPRSRESVGSTSVVAAQEATLTERRQPARAWVTQISDPQGEVLPETLPQYFRVRRWRARRWPLPTARNLASWPEGFSHAKSRCDYNQEVEVTADGF